MSTVSNASGKHTVLRSATREVVIGSAQPFCLIGERLNPTGRKIFAENLRRGDLSRIAVDVEQQVAGGATMLDVNMGVPLADEAELLAKAVTMIQEITDLPLCIDSSVVEALEAGLSAYRGKALVNSVTGERERLDAILPLVKRHGAAVIALPNEEDEIPEDPRKRLAITRKILDIAVGASNVSFGMPRREALGAAFVPMAMAHGLTSAVIDVRSPLIVDAVKAADVMMGNDEWGANWISAFRAQQRATQPA